MISCDPIYDSKPSTEWNRLLTQKDKVKPDFSVQTGANSWKALAQKAAVLAAKVLIFPVAVYELTFYIVQRLVMLPLFPLQSRLVQFVSAAIERVARYFEIVESNELFPGFSRRQLDDVRRLQGKRLTKAGYICRSVSFEKDGVIYGGMLVGKPETIENGQWVLQATGNAEPIEHSIDEFCKCYSNCHFNVLMVNGPNVGLGRGVASPKTMGEAQELGLSFLETAMKAKKIVMAGRSLGGAAVGQAILQHTFRDNIDYMVIRQMSFDRVSNICAKVVAGRRHRFGALIKWVIRQAGLEMDSVAASKKLQKLGIREIIVQRSGASPQKPIPNLSDFQTDGPIPARASLGYRLVKEGVTENKDFICVPWIRHMSVKAIEATLPYISTFGTPLSEAI